MGRPRHEGNSLPSISERWRGEVRGSSEGLRQRKIIGRREREIVLGSMNREDGGGAQVTS